MTTKATNELPEIKWDRGDFQEHIEYTNCYCALGYSDDGREWAGNWLECCGEVEIEDIEEM